MEIDECKTALNSDIVLQEVEDVPTCITNHPGFNTLCLDKWSLRLTATKLRTRKKQQYRQTTTEDRLVIFSSLVKYTINTYYYILKYV